MKIIEWKKLEVVTNTLGIDVRKVYDTEHAQLMYVTLNPGEKLKKHITPVDVIFYVIEGSGTVEIGDEKKEVFTGSFIDSPAKIPHCWYNEGDSILRVLVIKVPQPTEASKLLQEE